MQRVLDTSQELSSDHASSRFPVNRAWLCGASPGKVWGHVKRAIYPLLLTGALAVLAMMWKQHRGMSQVLAWLDPHTAAAEGPPPASGDARTPRRFSPDSEASAMPIRRDENVRFANQEVVADDDAGFASASDVGPKPPATPAPQTYPPAAAGYPRSTYPPQPAAGPGNYAPPGSYAPPGNYGPPAGNAPPSNYAPPGGYTPPRPYTPAQPYPAAPTTPVAPAGPAAQPKTPGNYSDSGIYSPPPVTTTIPSATSRYPAASATQPAPEAARPAMGPATTPSTAGAYPSAPAGDAAPSGTRYATQPRVDDRTPRAIPYATTQFPTTVTNGGKPERDLGPAPAASTAAPAATGPAPGAWPASPRSAAPTVSAAAPGTGGAGTTSTYPPTSTYPTTSTYPSATSTYPPTSPAPAASTTSTYPSTSRYPSAADYPAAPANPLTSTYPPAAGPAAPMSTPATAAAPPAATAAARPAESLPGGVPSGQPQPGAGRPPVSTARLVPPPSMTSGDPAWTRPGGVPVSEPAPEKPADPFAETQPKAPSFIVGTPAGRGRDIIVEPRTDSPFGTPVVSEKPLPIASIDDEGDRPAPREGSPVAGDPSASTAPPIAAPSAAVSPPGTEAAQAAASSLPPWPMTDPNMTRPAAPEVTGATLLPSIEQRPLPPGAKPLPIADIQDEYPAPARSAFPSAATPATSQVRDATDVTDPFSPDAGYAPRSTDSTPAVRGVLPSDTVSPRRDPQSAPASTASTTKPEERKPAAGGIAPAMTIALPYPQGSGGDPRTAAPSRTAAPGTTASPSTTAATTPSASQPVGPAAGAASDPSEGGFMPGSVKRFTSLPSAGRGFSRPAMPSGDILPPIAAGPATTPAVEENPYADSPYSEPQSAPSSTVAAPGMIPPTTVATPLAVTQPDPPAREAPVTEAGPSTAPSTSADAEPPAVAGPAAPPATDTVASSPRRAASIWAWPGDEVAPRSDSQPVEDPNAGSNVPPQTEPRGMYDDPNNGGSTLAIRSDSTGAGYPPPTDPAASNPNGFRPEAGAPAQPPFAPEQLPPQPAQPYQPAGESQYQPSPGIVMPDRSNMTPERAAPPAEQFPTPDTSTKSGPAEVMQANVIARVNGDVILASEVIPAVEKRLEQAGGKIPEDQRPKIREMLIKQLLEQAIQRKILFLDAKRGIPEKSWPGVEEQLGEAFDEQIEGMLAEYKVNNRAQLEDLLLSQGTSLERQRQNFYEMLLARQWVQKHAEVNETVLRDELLAYYYDHQADFEIIAKAKWEELQVQFSRFPNREAAFAAMAAMGNRVLAGEPFAAVAKSGSHGFTADQGGAHDWTTRNSLKSKVIDDALFSLPVSQLSPIIESENGYHIIRIVERQDAGVVPFRDAQKEIKEKIIKDRKTKAQEEYLKKLRQDARVWTVFDEGNPNEPVAGVR